MRTLPPLLLLPFLFLALLIAVAGFMEHLAPPAKPEEVPAQKPVPGPGPTVAPDDGHGMKERPPGSTGAGPSRDQASWGTVNGARYLRVSSLLADRAALPVKRSAWGSRVSGMPRVRRVFLVSTPLAARCSAMRP